MEDLNTIAADCLVISCCCQCLILQILIIILLRVPYKLFRKAVSYAKKKLRNSKKRGGKINPHHTKRKRSLIHDSSFRAPHEGVSLSSNDDHECNQVESCMDEIDKVLEEFCLRGEFGFGRFWGGDGEASCAGSFPTCLGNSSNHHHQELDYDVVSYHLIKVFGSCNGTDDPFSF